MKKAFTRVISLSAAAACLISGIKVGPIYVYSDAAAPLTAFEITEEMQIGWNLGNTLDSHNADKPNLGVDAETSWGNPKTTQAMIDAVKAKGFNTVRIPTTWYQHLDGDNNIDPAWLARVKEVVDYAYNNGMYVILNLHHEEWVDRADLGTAYDEMKPKFTKIWTQIATEFKNYDQHLIFESMNEPRAKGTEHEWWGPQQSEVDTINKLNADFVKLVRSIDSPYAKNRLLMIPDYCASSDSSIYSKLVVPDDDYVAVSIHAYSPYGFTMDEKGSHDTYTSAYRSELQSILKGIRDSFIDKDIPVVLGEFSSSNYGNTQARVEWATDYVTTMKNYGIPCVLWDNNVEKNNGGEAHGYLNRSTLTWYPDSEPVVDAMMKVIADKSIPWGGEGKAPVIDHDDVSTGKSIFNGPESIDASVEDGNCTTPIDITWKEIEGKDIAVEFTGEAPVIAFTDDEWDNWTEVKPYDVDDEKGIAYFSDVDVAYAWGEDKVGSIAHLFVRTNGKTTVKNIYLIAASGADVERPAETAKVYNLDLSNANRNGELTIKVVGAPGTFTNGCLGFSVGSDWEQIEWEGTTDGNGVLNVKIKMSDIPANVTKPQFQIWYNFDVLDMESYSVDGETGSTTPSNPSQGGNTGSDTPSTPSTPSVTVEGGFHVDGQKIMDANNNEFIMYGINVAHAWYQSYTEASIKASAAKGTNTIRVVCADGGQWTKTSETEIKNIIKWCKENKQVCILEAHDATGSNNASDIVAAAQYWATMADILNENKAYVILNIANEWYGDWTSSAWADGASQAIKTVRDAGIENMLMIDSAGWGQYPQSIADKGAEVFAADPLKNTVFSIHFYEYAGGTAEQVKTNIDNALKCGAPVMVGEFGYKHTDGDVAEDVVMSYCEEKGMGYLAWSWKGNSGGVEYLDLVNDWEGSSLTEWGEIFFNTIKGKAKSASVFEGASANPNPTNPTPSTSGTWGDANNDGQVTMADAAAILQFLGNANKYPLSAEGKKLADVDGSAGITTSDALTIQKAVAGLISLKDLPLK